MREVDLNLRDIYRASDVTRWGIVKVARNQSVAEHSFQVAMIALRICGILGLIEGARDAALFALFHDLPEVLTGDIIAPLKQHAGQDFMSEIDKIEDSITYMGGAYRNGDFKLLYSETVQKIVKMADIIEAVAFLRANGMTQHSKQVEQRLVQQLRRGPFPEVADAVLDEILSGKETTLDELFGGDT